MADDKCIINPERDCIGLAAAEKLEARITALEDWKGSSREFHEKFYKWQREQDIKSAKLDEQLKTMDENIRKVVAYQEGQKDKPAKRWEAVWTAIIGVVVGFVLKSAGIF